MAKRAVGEVEEEQLPQAKRACEEPTAEHLLKHMRLKRIVKENHGSEIRAVVFNRVKAENYNLLATIAEDQVSIYDNANCGEHLDLILHFVNTPLPGALRHEVHLRCVDGIHQRQGKKQRDLYSLAWLAPTNEKTDAYLAIGSADNYIHIISIAKASVIKLLQGHSDAVTQLSSSAAAPDFLLSAAKDKSVRVWHIPSGDCVAYVDLHATALCWAADGRHFYTGSGHGVLKQWDLSSVLDNLENAHKNAVVLTQFNPLQKQHNSDIDCIKTLGTSVASKSTDGTIVVWDAVSGNAERRFKVKGPSDSASLFDISTDGRFLVAGNAQGTLFVWNVQTGEDVTKLKYRRKESRSPVSSCGIAHDLKSVVYATGGPYLWRWDYVDPVAIKNFQAKQEQE